MPFNSKIDNLFTFILLLIKVVKGLLIRSFNIQSLTVVYKNVNKIKK